MPGVFFGRDDLTDSLLMLLNRRKVVKIRSVSLREDGLAARKIEIQAGLKKIELEAQDDESNAVLIKVLSSSFGAAPHGFRDIEKFENSRY